MRDVDTRQLPPAEKERDRDRARREEACVANDGVEPHARGGHHGLRRRERRLRKRRRAVVALRAHRDDEGDEERERDRAPEDVPVPRRSALCADDVLQAHRSREDDHTDDRERRRHVPAEDAPEATEASADREARRAAARDERRREQRRRDHQEDDRRVEPRREAVLPKRRDDDERGHARSREPHRRIADRSLGSGRAQARCEATLDPRRPRARREEQENDRDREREDDRRSEELRGRGRSEPVERHLPHLLARFVPAAKCERHHLRARRRNDVALARDANAVDLRDDVAGRHPCLIRARARQDLLDRDPAARRRNRRPDDPEERERAIPFRVARLRDGRARRRRTHVERHFVERRRDRRRRRRRRGERDLELPVERRVHRVARRAAEARLERIGEREIDLLRVPHRRVGEDLRVLDRALPRPVQRPAKREVRRLSLRKPGPEDLDPVPDLRLARRDFEHLNELRRALAHAPQEKEREHQEEEPPRSGEHRDSYRVLERRPVRRRNCSRFSFM